MSYLLTLLTLFYEFFKTGLFSVGGGLATIPFLRDMGATYGWVTEAELANIVAIAESTPGPIGVNAATYVGFQAAGILGGIVATIGLITPSVIVIILVAKALDRFVNSKWIKALFAVLQPTAVGLVLAAGVSLLLTATHIHADFLALSFSASSQSIIHLAIYGVLTFLAFFKFTKKLHPIWFILIGGVLGIVFRL